MSSAAVPARLVEATAMLGLADGMRVLEIGCGPGAAAAHVLEGHDQLDYVAIDRSATAIDRTRRRNEASMDSGRLVARELELDSLTLAAVGGEPFDVAFAVNVNVFWTTVAGAELVAIAACLRAGAELWLAFETPGGVDRRDEVVAKVLASFEATDGAFGPPTVVEGDRIFAVHAATTGSPPA